MTLLLQASVILWDFKKLNILLQYESHKVRVEAVVFSSCDTYLISLGGPDDSNIVLWNIEVKEALCGSYASDRTSGDAVTLSPMNLRGPCFMTGGECTLKVWTLNVLDRNLRSMNVSLGKIKRIITCIEIDYRDEFAYCGTSTGDIVKVKLNYSHDINILDPIVKPVLIGCFAKFPKKISSKQPLEAERYSQGVGAILLLDDDSIIVGAGDGTVDMVRERDVSPDSLIQKRTGKLINPSLPMLIMIRSVHVGSTVTSAQKLGDELLIGTIQCELYVINMKTFSVKLMATCHTSTIYDIAFPSQYSDVFATASKDDVRVWSVQTSQELLRISVPNFTCSGVIFTHDGKAIITSWNDGTIRAFTPQSGRLIFTILSAHNKGVSAIAITTDNCKIISGGGEGQVRVWDVKPSMQTLQFVLKEHKGPVSSIDVSNTNKEAVTASTDGTCIIWNIESGSRLAILFSSTLFMCVRYHPSSCQVITCGTNRMIGYWEIFDGSLIREVEGSKSSALNTLDITANGKHFATGGSDQIIK
ncbi:LOW QUALITY PROTEIN: cilia- and flagella-associated protein 52-like, partial [Homalodisca vitripennis]|uniref:LOW QUALITY PROTEIN: cilia- and flagella-associated protein 52-like n=1 Tax=Homalodisca vitripennis TaxID=197043 RepID=UPI001EEADB8A